MESGSQSVDDMESGSQVSSEEEEIGRIYARGDSWNNLSASEKKICKLYSKKVTMIEGKPHKPSWESDARIGGWYAMDDTISDILEKKKKAKYRWHMKEVPLSRHYYDLKNMTQYIQLLDGNEWKTITGNDGSTDCIGMDEWKMRRIYREVTKWKHYREATKRKQAGMKDKKTEKRKQAGMKVKKSMKQVKKSMKVKKVKRFKQA